MTTLNIFPSTIDLDVLNFSRLSPTKSTYPNSYQKGSLTKKCSLKISAVSCDSITTTDSSSKDSSSSNLESPRNVMDFRGSLSSLDNQDELPSIFNSGSKSNSKRKSTVDETKYKTEMCKKWESMGSCPYGKKCKFAHGRDELNNRPNQKKYKSKNCNSFHTSMICPYGSRCQFAHENRTLDELFARPEANLLDAFVAKEGLEVKNRRLPCFRKFAQH